MSQTDERKAQGAMVRKDLFAGWTRKNRRPIQAAGRSQIRHGYCDCMKTIVILHTGGSAALFGSPDMFHLPGYT